MLRNLRGNLSSKLAAWVGAEIVTIHSAGDGWPSHLEVRTPQGALNIAAHMGSIGASHRQRDVERRLQNPGRQRGVQGQKRSGVALVLGLSEEMSHPVIVGLDATRLCRNTRQSAFITASQIRLAAQEGWAENVNAAGERIVAFTPPRFTEYVRLFKDVGGIGSPAATAPSRDVLPEPAPALQPHKLPSLTLSAVLEFGPKVDDGRLVQAVAVPWYAILDIIEQDASAIYQIPPFKWEEIIAGAYKAARWDEVILTPRSGDAGRDVIAVKKGIGGVRIFDQIKAYKPGRVVTAEDVRAMLGVITAHRNVSKGVITTTSEFAPRLLEDKAIAAHIPYRLELKPRDKLLAWLAGLKKNKT